MLGDRLQQRRLAGVEAAGCAAGVGEEPLPGLEAPAREDQRRRQCQGVLRASAQQGADPGQQLVWIEGFGQLVVSAELQTSNAVDRLALCAQHEHGWSAAS